VRDDTIDKLTFEALTQPIKDALLSQQYVIETDQNRIELFIVVFWGTTLGSVGEPDGQKKDRIDTINAALLGFDSEKGVPNLMYLSPFGQNFRSSFLRDVRADVIGSLEIARYFVILRAFDFRAAKQRKQIKLLWETRLSLSQRRHAFDEELPAMVQNASIYFGQDNRGLIKKAIPEGHVEIGEAKSLGEVP
jgi:hypothetical protein